jgi:hypothetical protein
LSAAGGTKTYRNESLRPGFIARSGYETAMERVMRNSTAGAIGGVVAGVILSGVMAVGRDAGLLHEMLADRAGDWLDGRFGTREWAGDDGAQALEQANHLAASAAFGAVYGATRPLTRSVPPVAAGALFGAGLYAVALAGAAPGIGLSDGEDYEPGAVALQRFRLHVVFGVISAVVADALAPIRRAAKPESNGS